MSKSWKKIKVEGIEINEIVYKLAYWMATNNPADALDFLVEELGDEEKASKIYRRIFKELFPRGKELGSNPTLLNFSPIEANI
ncbi:MAG: hypothetical protein ACTSYM_07550 [Candidatus Baldrarchaeia archaeon]